MARSQKAPRIPAPRVSAGDRLQDADTFARAARRISARSYNSDNRQGLAPCNEWRLSYFFYYWNALIIIDVVG